jgi:hypothetical protein
MQEQSPFASWFHLAYEEHDIGHMYSKPLEHPSILPRSRHWASESHGSPLLSVGWSVWAHILLSYQWDYTTVSKLVGSILEALTLRLFHVHFHDIGSWFKQDNAPIPRTVSSSNIVCTSVSISKRTSSAKSCPLGSTDM